MNLKQTSFYAIEAECEKNFTTASPFWHLATNGNEIGIIFTNDDDYRYAINALAISMIDIDIKLISFAIMSNHIHLLISGAEKECLRFFELYKNKLKTHFSRNGIQINWDKFKCDNLIPITSLNMLRNEIAYIHRNAYAARPDVTPYSYPWSSAYAYFNVPLKFESTVLSKIQARERREILHMKTTSFPIDYHITNGMILADDFCDIGFGMSVFRDARQYFFIISKAYEAYSECAKRLGENILTTDDDLYSIINDICRKEYSKNSVSLLSPNEKLEIARTIHNKYNAQNNQIRRMLKLDIDIVNELFGE